MAQGFLFHDCWGDLGFYLDSNNCQSCDPVLPGSTTLRLHSKTSDAWVEGLVVACGGLWVGKHQTPRILDGSEQPANTCQYLRFLSFDISWYNMIYPACISMLRISQDPSVWDDYQRVRFRSLVSWCDSRPTRNQSSTSGRWYGRFQLLRPNSSRSKHSIITFPYVSFHFPKRPQDTLIPSWCGGWYWYWWGRGRVRSRLRVQTTYNTIIYMSQFSRPVLYHGANFKYLCNLLGVSLAGSQLDRGSVCLPSRDILASASKNFDRCRFLQALYLQRLGIQKIMGKKWF